MVRFFDCNCMLGPVAVPQPATFTSLPELLAELDYCGIENALVYHSAARDVDPADGNRKLLNETGTATGRRIHPCWVVLPHHTGEMPAPEELLRQLRGNGVRAVRIFPVAQRWSLSAWSAGPLLAALEDAQVPVFVNADQIGWDELYRLGRAYQALPIVLCEARYEDWRNLYPLLEQLPGLHIDICWMVTHGWLEAGVARFGAERFLFGTRLPWFTPGPAITQVMYAEIAEDQRSLIAGGNLERLLNWQEGA